MDNEKSNLVVQKRINKILETRFDSDKDTLEALKDLSTFFTENTLQTRRNLRSQIEKRSLTINEDFLEAFRGVKNALNGIYEDVAAMSTSVQKMKLKLQDTNAQTRQLIEQTNALQDESNTLSTQEEIAAAFVQRFQLSPEQHVTLYGANRNSPIDDDFFKVLDRVQQIHNECRVLVQSGYQTSALDIMEQMTLHQEAALERLYRWSQVHCRAVEGSEVNILVTKAMSCLQDRPVLFKYVLDEFSTSRRSVLVRAFIDALTVGGPNGNPAPIEMHAHDPKRYVGDMFSWLHQAIPTEKEGLLGLVKLCDNSDVSEQIQLALANITDGVCHPLKVRVEIILSSEKQATTLYSVANLIRFYQNIIGNVVTGGQLETTLTDLQDQSERAYLKSLQSQVTIHLNQGAPAPPNDLSPSVSVTHLLDILKEILSIATMVEGRQSDIKKIVSCVLDPLLHAVTETASHLPTTDMAVYLLNCLYHMQCTLALYEYMDDRLERLQGQSDAQLDTLTSEQASSLVANLNLGPIYTILQEQSKQPLSSVPGMETSSLKVFLGKLENLIEMPEMLLLPQVSLLISSAHRTTVQKRAFNVIVAIYSQLYEKVYDPENGYSNPSLIMLKTPQEITDHLIGS